MKLTLAEPRYLKDSVTVISELVNEARFKITPDAVELVAMDPANVAMVIFKLLSSSFVEYNIKDTTELSINLDNLKKILRRASPTDVLTLELDKAKLKITLKGRATRTFSLPILELEEKEQKIPSLNFPISVTTTTNVLDEAIEDVDIVAESVSLEADPETFIISAEGDMSHAKIEIKQSEDTSIKVDENAKVKSRYSIEYLKKIIKGSKLANNVTVMFNKDYPLRVEYKVIDKLLLAFILAPRVDND
ncbi:proliferating cell nuclear antigen (pcna) [Candidatus Woesearchaeota archaeon]|nr:proliferating cell nuclear antigen (pcna) [Candidatus Woesearchaeota archaeon]MBW3013857.1 proliferating cell nuclear antigen (pcna) [Candidatus Woesearchaeota archaeon]